MFKYMADKKSTTKDAAGKKGKKVEPLKPVKAFARNLHIAPRKMRLVTNLIKNMHVGDALARLQFAEKKAAPIVIKLLKSAIANAEHNFQYKPSTLYITHITCDGAQVAKRYFPRARGSAFVIRHRMSHVNLVLESIPKKAKDFGMTTRKSVKEADVTEETEATVTELPDKGATPKLVPAKAGIQPKANEVVKANKIQNKRRMFNRKSGE